MLIYFFGIYYCSYGVVETNGLFLVRVTKPVRTWFHAVINFEGATQDVRIYHNGTEVGHASENLDNRYTHGSGRIVVGRRFIDSNRNYATVQVDELLFFNQHLTTSQITALSRFTTS